MFKDSYLRLEQIFIDFIMISISCFTFKLLLTTKIYDELKKLHDFKNDIFATCCGNENAAMKHVKIWCQVRSKLVYHYSGKDSYDSGRPEK